MLSTAHVNKNHRSAEPGDDGEALTTQHRRDFVKCVGRERDKQARLTEQRRRSRTTWRSVVVLVQVQRASAVAILLWLRRIIIEKHDQRDATNTQMIELELVGVAVLMPHEEIAWFVTQKLWLLAVGQ